MLCCDSWDGNNYVYCRFICFFIGLFIEYFLFVFLKDCFLGGKERERERGRGEKEVLINILIVLMILCYIYFVNYWVIGNIIFIRKICSGRFYLKKWRLDFI